MKDANPELDQKQADRAKILEWANAYLEIEHTTYCRYDHHGQCQEHFMALDDFGVPQGCLQGEAIRAYRRLHGIK